MGITGYDAFRNLGPWIQLVRVEVAQFEAGCQQSAQTTVKVGFFYIATTHGLGQSRINFIMGVVEGFILRIGLTYLQGVAMGFGIQGFWYGSAIASYGYGLVVFPYFLS